MKTLQQEVENRSITGKKVKSLRRAGITPANIFGAGIESHSIQADTVTLLKTLVKAGGTQLITLKNPSDKDRKVLIKGIHVDPLTDKLLHVDFHQVSLKDKVKVAVPLVFEGEAPASRKKDLVLLENLNSIDVECLPTEIPENIVVDISGLAEAGDRLLVSDLPIDEKITVFTHEDELVASVSQAKVVEEVEKKVEEGVEAEVAAEGDAGKPAAGVAPAKESGE
jgi:large subunit ribosomal protein L25